MSLSTFLYIQLGFEKIIVMKNKKILKIIIFVKNNYVVVSIT